MKITPRLLRFVLNLYGPYLGAGVRVNYIAKDWKVVEVSMKLRWYNRNAVGCHFGGSLYSMVDPHLMLMLMQLLGNNYIVWDKDAQISFIRPGRGRVSARLQISDEDIASLKKDLEKKRKSLPRFEVEIVDEEKKTVTRVCKTLYVRRKSHHDR